MNTLESYALNCGVKIDTPFIYEQFFALPFEKYVVFGDFRYRHYQEVIDIIHPKLMEKDIHILHLSQATNNLYSDTHSVKEFSPNQSAYIIRHSLACFGESSFFTDVASFYDKKVVCLYSNMYVNNTKPYWSSPKNTINLESNKQGDKPWFDIEDDTSTINTIKPEKIAKSILNSLDIDYDNDYESIFFGMYFDSNDIIIDLVPDDYPSFTVNSNQASIRMDLRYDEDFLSRQLKLGTYDVYSDKPIPEEVLLPIRKKINRFFYIITENDKPEFVDLLKKLSIKTMLITHAEEEFIIKKKINYMDHSPIINLRVKNAEEIDIIKDEDINNLFYLSSKIYLDKGIIYPSQYAWENMLSARDINSISKFENNQTLLRDLPHFKILKKPLDRI
jgi:hypothetical protein